MVVACMTGGFWGKTHKKILNIHTKVLNIHTKVSVFFSNLNIIGPESLILIHCSFKSLKNWGPVSLVCMDYGLMHKG